MFLYRLKKYLRTALITSLLIALTFYFGFHLFDGDKGLISFWQLQDERLALRQELKRLELHKADLKKKLAKLDNRSIDGDYLDEMARKKLGVVGERDLVILRPKADNR